MKDSFLQWSAAEPGQAKLRMEGTPKQKGYFVWQNFSKGVHTKWIPPIGHPSWLAEREKWDQTLQRWARWSGRLQKREINQPLAAERAPQRLTEQIRPLQKEALLHHVPHLTVAPAATQGHPAASQDLDPNLLRYPEITPFSTNFLWFFS